MVDGANLYHGRILPDFWSAEKVKLLLNIIYKNCI